MKTKCVPVFYLHSFLRPPIPSKISGISITFITFRVRLHQASESTLGQLCNYTSNTVLIENDGVAQKKGCKPHSGVTLLFSMRVVSLALSESCRSIDTDPWCKRALRPFPTLCGQNIFQNMRPYDEVTLSETETDNETEIDKRDTVPIGISVSVQCEHLHTILWKSFFYWCRSLLVWRHRNG